MQEKRLVKKNAIEDELIETENEESNIFTNVEYKGLYDFDKSFTVKSEKASIAKEDPNVVRMTKMKVMLSMNDGRIITITSDKGIYNKATYNIFFEKNVKSTDGETIITSDNLSLMTTEDSAVIYNNVSLTSSHGTVNADSIEYDFNTHNYLISMFDKGKVEIKLIQ